ncbi:MAG: DUF3422 domain-containing protein, partial [Pseudomonadota bacterium]
MTPIEDHPLRYKLANELHARPFPEASAPSTVVFLAMKKPDDAVTDDRLDNLNHLIDLLDRHGAQHPQPEATHYAGPLGRHWLKWEQHTEFVTYTAITQSIRERPFDPADFEVFASDWLMDAPGQRVTSVMIRVVERGSDADVRASLGQWFEPESLAVARMLDDAAICASDFRIDPAGHMRFAVFSAQGTGQRRTGRIVQRMCEIETYKAMSMLGFALVKQLTPRIGALDSKLTELMGHMT